MRRTITTLFAVFALALSTQLNAQIDILPGIGLTVGTASGAGFGMQFRGDVDITDTWGGSLNFIPYFSSGNSYWEVNFDGHYMFFDSDPWSAYALAGLNISTVGIKGLGGIGIPGINSTKVGLNIGGGARYEIAENILLYGEIKYIISSFDQLVISVGGLYRFSL